MSGRPAARRLAVYGLAAGGVLLGHALTYGLLVPDAHARAAALAGTGHGYLAAAGRVGLGLALVALGVTFLRGLTQPASRSPGLGALLVRLGGFQLAAFAAMELAERLGAGASLHDLPVVLGVGLAVQSAVAFGAALLLRAVLRLATSAARVLAAVPAPLPRPALAVALPSAPASAHPAHNLLPRRRGPPPAR